VYPALQPIPGYPVYYAPGVGANYFFYDGLYWVFDGDNWYESPWYNGPWSLVDPYAVPVFLLRVPVRYYAHPPSYFRAWAYDAAPRWGDHWGHSWSTRRAGWDRWNRNAVPAAAPLPTYQRAYTGSRYPQNVAEQATIASRSYTYQPRDAVVRQRFQERRAQVQATAPQASPQYTQRQERIQQSQPAPQHPQRQERIQQTQPAPQYQQRQERIQQTQQYQQQRQERAAQIQAQQQQRQERAAQVQQAQQQRQERVQQAQQQRVERGQQQAMAPREAHGQGQGQGRGRGRGPSEEDHGQHNGG